MSLGKSFCRLFSSSDVVMKPGYSTVHPIHHLIKVNRAVLKPRYKEVLIPKDDIRSIGYKPTEIDQDRILEHYKVTIQPDLLLSNYRHAAETIVGEKLRSWGADSPYKLYRPLRKPKGHTRQRRDIKPITEKNIPALEAISIQAFNTSALQIPWLNISTRLQLSQITNVKAKQIYAKSDVLLWHLRKGKPCGAKVELTGRDMTQFLSTLIELVLPRIQKFLGIKDTSGDSQGNLTFGLGPESLRMFPEIENFQELFPNLCGMHITFKTSARTDEQARELLSAFGFPFYSPEKN